jgi:outer membrane receptor protein involved in Fe transport
VNLLHKNCGLWAAVVLRCRAAHLLPAALVAGAGLLATAPAEAQGTAVLTGTVVDTATKRPLADVVVTVTSPALQGEQTVVTDKSGAYRIPNLPAGDYTLRLEGDAYKPYSRGGIALHVNATIRVNAELLPEGIKAEEVVVVGKAPTVDVGSSSTGVTLNQDFVSRIALNAPGGKAAASRSFESLATVAPGAKSDAFGVSVNGATSPENNFVLDGVSVNDPAFGILGTPLSVEFVKELGIITGGYMPEYGKATGGIFDVVTKSGGNEFHGSVFFNVTPGSLEGPRTQIKSAGTTITTQPSLSSLRDFGADIGGYILKDRLWFYGGLQFAFNRQRLSRTLNEFQYKADPDHIGGSIQQFDKDGFPITKSLGTPVDYFAEERSIQYIGKLTFLINQDHNLTLSVIGTPTRSGGSGMFPFDNTGSVAVGNIIGPYNTIGGQYFADSNDVSLKYSGAFNNKRQLIDITFGWHHQHQGTLAADGTGPKDVASRTGLAGQPEVVYRLNSPDWHSITDFERMPSGRCKPVQVWDPTGGDAGTGALVTKTPCPVENYAKGGPGYLDDTVLDSYQGKAVFTDLLQAAGHHVIKAGVDFAYNSYQHDKAYSGGDVYRENTIGTRFDDYRLYGFMTGPDQAKLLDHYTSKTHTVSVGGFLQDSWQIMDKVTLNVGVRYDAQYMFGADGTMGLALPNQWSPRVGVIYDFTQQGRSKLYANFARYYEGVPLDMADRSFPSEPQVYSRHRNTVCDPTSTGATQPNLAGCSDDAGRRVYPSGAWHPATNDPSQASKPMNPSQLWNRVGGGKEPVDPDVSPQSSDEFVVGGEYEVFENARVGVSYTHRYLNKAIEDMSRDEANTYFIGNPGFGIAKDFPKAVRNYDAMTVYFTKNYSNTWLFNASYTLSRLYGNYAGLFRPETAQLDPNITSDFDLRSLLRNRMGLLPGDSTHQLKFYAAKDFVLPAGMDILVGLTYRTRSGAPLNALGSHNLYGSDEVYVIPRGAGGTLNTKDFTINTTRGDWIHNIDMRVGYSVRLSKDSTLGVTMDVFNIFNFQGVTGRDPRYTNSDVAPCAAGGKVPKCVSHSDPGDTSAFDPKNEVNPNYGKPTAYQDPRQFRFGAKVTF